eukprot:1160734-Pelagomonas_calceolata.AAC.1
MRIIAIVNAIAILFHIYGTNYENYSYSDISSVSCSCSRLPKTNKASLKVKLDLKLGIQALDASIYKAFGSIAQALTHTHAHEPTPSKRLDDKSILQSCWSAHCQISNQIQMWASCEAHHIYGRLSVQVALVSREGGNMNVYVPFCPSRDARPGPIGKH